MQLVITAHQDGHSLDAVEETLTAGELADILTQQDPDTPVYISLGEIKGVPSFGGIREADFWSPEKPT